jgi:hypothetical protein
VLGSFDAAVCCAAANKRLKPPASLIQQRRIPACAGIFLNYQNQTYLRKPQGGGPLASGSLSAAAKPAAAKLLGAFAATHLKILGKQ